MIRSDPWKFQSIWKSENWQDQTELATFLASAGSLFISDKVIGGIGTYFTLNAGNIEFWDNGVLRGIWQGIPPLPPGALTGQLMGLLCLTYN
jgi:hypothetical protein